MPINQKKKTITLYDKAELYYQDVELKAGIIVMNNEKRTKTLVNYYP
jgi:hypothetical protein